MTKVGKWSDISESIIPVCTGILMLLVSVYMIYKGGTVVCNPYRSGV